MPCPPHLTLKSLHAHSSLQKPYTIAWRPLLISSCLHLAQWALPGTESTERMMGLRLHLEPCSVHPPPSHSQGPASSVLSRALGSWSPQCQLSQVQGHRPMRISEGIPSSKHLTVRKVGQYTYASTMFTMSTMCSL